jgi:hypothetical protein
MTGVRLVLAELGELVRQRFAAADGLVCSCGDGDTILWQVVAGHEVVWNALPDVEEQIPEWHALPRAADLLHRAVSEQGCVGDLVVVRLPCRVSPSA